MAKHSCKMEVEHRYKKLLVPAELNVWLIGALLELVMISTFCPMVHARAGQASPPS